MARTRKTNHPFEHFHGDRSKPIHKMRRCSAEDGLEIIEQLPDGHFINRNEDYDFQLLWIILERVSQEKEEEFKNRQFQLFDDNSKLLKNNNKTKEKKKKKMTFAKVFTQAINKVKHTSSNRIHSADLIFSMADQAELRLHDRSLSKESLIKDKIEEMKACANKLYEQQRRAEKFGARRLLKKSNTVNIENSNEIYDNGEDLTAYHAREWPKRTSGYHLNQ